MSLSVRSEKVTWIRGKQFQEATTKFSCPGFNPPWVTVIVGSGQNIGD